MRVNIHGLNMNVSSDLKRHAETRLWMAAHGTPRPAGWAQVLLERDEAGQRVNFRFDAWVRGIGVVSARGSAPGPLRAIDLAAHRLQQAIAQRTAGHGPAEDQPRNGDDAALPHHSDGGSRDLPQSATADRERTRSLFAADSCRFLDYDPVGLPHE
jgi:ribosome-associated translation inhibitor RaiA